MPKIVPNIFKFFRAVLSRRIVFWVFVSVIAIETIIFFPSLRNRERELLTQLKNLSAAKIEVMMKTEPGHLSDEEFLARVRLLLLDDVIIGAALYHLDGSRVGAVGEPPELVFTESTAHLRDKVYRLENRYDVVCLGQAERKMNVLVVRHDTTTVRNALYAFFVRIVGLVIIISVVVTLGAMMAFDMGGPINKSAYAFSVGLIDSELYTPMAAVMAAGMTPPLGLAPGIAQAPALAPPRARDPAPGPRPDTLNCGPAWT